MKYKKVLGYEGLYIVYENGDVESLDRLVNYRINGYKKKVYGRKIKTTVNTRGYKQLSLCKNGIVKSTRIHKIVAEAFIGERPEGLQIAHLDGNKLNNHYTNLIYATPKENASHKILHGTVSCGKRNGKYTKPEITPRGEKHGMSKLKLKQVKFIRKSKKPSRKLAKKYNVSKTLILKIKSNQLWRQ